MEPKTMPEFEDRLIEINRVSRTVKGGRRIRFRALVVVGNRQGQVGIGLGKAAEVQAAIAAATTAAKRRIFSIPMKNGTILHQVTGIFSGSSVILKPAKPGTSVIAGGPVRAMADVAGITDIITKSLGSPNKLNTIRAMEVAFKSLRTEHVHPQENKTPHPEKTQPKKLETAKPKTATREKSTTRKPNTNVVKEKNGPKRSAKK